MLIQMECSTTYATAVLNDGLFMLEFRDASPDGVFNYSAAVLSDGIFM